MGDDFQGRIIARFAYEDLNATRAALLYDVANTYNQGLADTFTKEFRRQGGQIVASETYTTDRSLDFRQSLEAIQTANPDLLFLPNYSGDVRRQLRQAEDVGLKVTFLGADAWNDLPENPFPELEGSFYTTLWHPQLQQSGNAQFIQAYRQAYGESPDASAALAYDAIALLAQAIETQNSTAPDAIRQGLQQLQPYQGVSGTIDYQGTGDPVKAAIIVKVENGQAQLYRQIDPQPAP
ncbi:MAG: ABC transporter substrate-binding protein [Kamptonema sp. SIO4C4]|nr:ABC transporter substrate-binding protein [Kamptonema sp. SIO4C4]